MRKYIEKWISNCPPQQDKARFVRCVLEGAQKHEREVAMVYRGTKSLVALSRKHGKGMPVEKNAIISEAGIGETRSAGLWVWLEGQAGVVDELKNPIRFVIKPDYFDAMLDLFQEDSGFMRLRGLGKEIWERVDPEEYVERERRNWGG